MQLPQDMIWPYFKHRHEEAQCQMDHDHFLHTSTFPYDMTTYADSLLWRVIANLLHVFELAISNEGFTWFTRGVFPSQVMPPIAILAP